MQSESNRLEAVEKDLPHLSTAHISAKITRLVDKLKDLGIDLLTPCGHEQQGFLRTCRIAWYLPEINEVLWTVSMHITENTPGSFTLSSVRGRSGKIRPDIVLLDGAILAYWLLRHHTCVTRLEVEGEAVLVSRFPSLLSNALKGNKGLEEARIGHQYGTVFFRSPCVPALVSTAVAKLRLERLDSTSHILDEEAVTSITGAVRGGKLRHLVLHNSVSSRLAHQVFQDISASSNLASLQFDGSGRFSRSRAVLLASALSHTKTLRKLSIDGLGRGVLAIILGALKHNDSLQELSLEYSTSSPLSELRDGAQALCTNKRLRYLKLSNLDLPNFAATVIADVLTKNSSIEELCLPLNDFCDSGACDLAKALLRNLSLRRLDLSGHRLSVASVSHFAEALSKNSVVERVRLGKIYISEDWTPSSPLTAELCARLHVTWNTRGLEQWAVGLREGNLPLPALYVACMETVASTGFVQFFTAVGFVSVTELTIHLPHDIRPTCVSVIPSFLESTKTLKKLVVCGVDQRPDFVTEVIKGLTVNKTVSEAEIEYSLSQKVVMRAVASLLRENRTLQHLQFSALYLQDYVLRPLSRALEENCVVLTLDFRYAPYAGQLRPIQNALSRNRFLLNRAVECVSKGSRDTDSLRAVRLLSAYDSLVDAVAEVSGKTREESRLLVRESLRCLELSTDTRGVHP